MINISLLAIRKISYGDDIGAKGMSGYGSAAPWCQKKPKNQKLSIGDDILNYKRLCLWVCVSVCESCNMTIFSTVWFKHLNIYMTPARQGSDSDLNI